MNLISIIVPIYKVEAYLERCVNSLKNQSYKNIEIILVDDGSPDRCPELCDELAKTDSRIRVLHKENGGLSSARNAGIDVAKGEYIVFVDSDDYIAENMLEKMHQRIVADRTDMCICDFCFVNEEGKSIEVPESQFPFKDAVYKREDILKVVCSASGLPNEWRIVPAWNKMYHKDVLKYCRFEEGRLHEDEFAIHHFVYACKKISMVSDKLYYYVQREKSIMNSTFSVKRFDAAIAFQQRYLFLKEKKETDLLKYVLSQLAEYLIHNLHKYEVRKNLDIIKPMVQFTVVEMIKKGNRRFIKLVQVYWQAVLKNK
ncbi:MAG: glycosyltransferase family 2 protein [Agathobacter sp.]|nr:glycosyltransferase family 2 protein [Agathobacter sp.]